MKIIFSILFMAFLALPVLSQIQQFEIHKTDKDSLWYDIDRYMQYENSPKYIVTIMQDQKIILVKDLIGEWTLPYGILLDKRICNKFAYRVKKK